MRARLVFWRSRASGMGANAVDKTSTFVGVFQNKRALLLAAVKGLNIVGFPNLSWRLSWTTAPLLSY